MVSIGTLPTWITSCVTPSRRSRLKGEKRWKLFGETGIGRYLVAVFTIRRKRFRTVTAYEMNAAERNKYGSQIG
jgi:uncharacterized DUF497 family protein